MSTIWLRYPPNESEPLQKQFYDCLTEDDQLIRRVWPSSEGSFQRAGVYVRGEKVVAIRIADDSPLSASTCPFCAQDTSPDHV